MFISLFYMLRSDLKFDICGKQLREFYSRELHRPIIHKSQIPEHAVKVMGHTVKGLTEIGCNVVAPGSAKFLFIPDITFKATGVALAILIILYVGSQLASTLVATATADPNQRRLMLLLPVVFVVILYRYPAGLLLYWITTNLWTIGQQYVMRQRIGPPPARAAPAKGSADGKPERELKPALAGAGVSGTGRGDGASAPPPRPPRKKKKRSGRRR